MPDGMATSPAVLRPCGCLGCDRVRIAEAAGQIRSQVLIELEQGWCHAFIEGILADEFVAT